MGSLTRVFFLGMAGVRKSVREASTLFSIGIGLTCPHDPDLMVGKAEVHFWELNLGHVAGDAIAHAHRAGRGGHLGVLAG